MTDQDYIRKAVELADGWQLHPKNHAFVGPTWPIQFSFNGRHQTPQQVKDALAAQLVRQVDALDGWELEAWPNETTLHPRGLGTEFDSCRFVEGKDRTMNTIKAIVDSKVLETP